MSILYILLLFIFLEFHCKIKTEKKNDFIKKNERAGIGIYGFCFPG